MKPSRVVKARSALEDEILALDQFVQACDGIASVHSDCPPWLFVVMGHSSRLRARFDALCAELRKEAPAYTLCAIKGKPDAGDHP